MDDIDPSQRDTSVYKSIDDSWIALLVLSILISVSSVIAIPVLYFCWRRYQQSTQVDNKNYILSNNPTGKRQIPIQIDDQPPKPYEIQQIDTFVPPQDDIQRAQQFYERTTKAYF